MQVFLKLHLWISCLYNPASNETPSTKHVLDLRHVFVFHDSVKSSEELWEEVLLTELKMENDLAVCRLCVLLAPQMSYVYPTLLSMTAPFEHINEIIWSHTAPMSHYMI